VTNAKKHALNDSLFLPGNGYTSNQNAATIARESSSVEHH